MQSGDQRVDIGTAAIKAEGDARKRRIAKAVEQRLGAVMARSNRDSFAIQKGR